MATICHTLSTGVMAQTTLLQATQTMSPTLGLVQDRIQSVLRQRAKMACQAR
jgi:hypothetical protein